MRGISSRTWTGDRLVRIAAAAAVVALASVTVSGQTFERVETQTRFREMNHVFAVTDVDGDGLDDFVVGGQIETAEDLTPRDRLRKAQLRSSRAMGTGRSPTGRA